MCFVWPQPFGIELVERPSTSPESERIIRVLPGLDGLFSSTIALTPSAVKHSLPQKKQETTRNMLFFFRIDRSSLYSFNTAHIKRRRRRKENERTRESHPGIDFAGVRPQHTHTHNRNVQHHISPTMGFIQSGRSGGERKRVESPHHQLFFSAPGPFKRSHIVQEKRRGADDLLLDISWECTENLHAHVFTFNCEYKEILFLDLVIDGHWLISHRGRKVSNGIRWWWCECNGPETQHGGSCQLLRVYLMRLCAAQQQPPFCFFLRLAAATSA